jgi:hypothetical protein
MQLELAKLREEARQLGHIAQLHVGWMMDGTDVARGREMEKALTWI